MDLQCLNLALEKMNTRRKKKKVQNRFMNSLRASTLHRRFSQIGNPGLAEMLFPRQVFLRYSTSTTIPPSSSHLSLTHLPSLTSRNPFFTADFAACFTSRHRFRGRKVGRVGIEKVG